MALLALACAGAVAACGGPAGRRRPGRPTPTTNSCSTSISASCGSATACAPIRRPKAPASCSATSSTALDVPMKIDLAAKKRQRLGVQGRPQDRHRPSPPARPASAASRSRSPRDRPRNARGLVRRQRGARPLVRDRRQADDRRLGCCCSSPKPSCRSSWRSSAQARAARSSRRVPTSKACRRSACPIACGAPRRSTSSSAPASPIAPRPASRSTARPRSMPPARSPICPTTRSPRPTARACPARCALRAYRSDPDGGLLGPLKATHFGFGDVAGLAQPLIGRQPAAAARWSPTGRCSTRQPSTGPASKATCRPAGTPKSIATANCWLLPRRTARQRYAFRRRSASLWRESFRNRPLRAPGAESQPRSELINVGQDNVPAGKTWYWAGRQPAGHATCRQSSIATTAAAPIASRRFRSPTPGGGVGRAWPRRAHLGRRAGRPCWSGDERLTFVEGSVRRSVGPALVEVAVARDSGGGIAARAQLLARSARSMSAPKRSLRTISHQRPSASSASRRPAGARRAAAARPAAIPGHADVRLSTAATAAARSRRRPGCRPISTASTSPPRYATSSITADAAPSRPGEFERRPDRLGPRRRRCACAARRSLEFAPTAGSARPSCQRLLVGVRQGRLGRRARL